LRNKAECEYRGRCGSGTRCVQSGGVLSKSNTCGALAMSDRLNVTVVLARLEQSLIIPFAVLPPGFGYTGQEVLIVQQAIL